MLGLRVYIALVAAGGAAPAFAHSREELASGWTLSPELLIPLGLGPLLYAVGYARLSRRATKPPAGAALFGAGWLVLALSLTSPLHKAGERSFTMHMIEHELIMLVATFLLAASSAGGVLAWGLPRALRLSLGGGWTSPLQRLWKLLTEPVTATAVQAVVMLVWHLPAVFDRALEHSGWHIAQHASFFVSALLFWWAMLHPRSGYGVSAACLFVTSLVGGGLGALMSFAQGPWYSAYAAMGLSGIGLDPVTDQQLAGLLMWIPGGLVHGMAALLFFYRWLKSSEGGTHALSIH